MGPAALALIAVLVILPLLLVAWWLLQVTEGVLLGPRVVRWFYDKDARRYEAIKGFDARDERDFVALPLFHRLDEGVGPDARILDVATGTGRLPTAILDIPFYTGRIVGVDASGGMLGVAAERLAGQTGRVTLLQSTVPPLPFADASFDAVCLMEALEFLPDRAAALAELVRVLVPGGILLVSNRRGWERRLFLSHAEPARAFETRLAALGLVAVETRPWQTYYDLVWARKAGAAAIWAVPETPPWPAALRCRRCAAEGDWEATRDGAVASGEAAGASRLRCRRCGQGLALGAGGYWMWRD